MEHLVGKYYMDDETLMGVDSFPELPDIRNLFYEVIRVVNSKPLFLKEHYLRIQNSAVHAEGGFSLDFTGCLWAISKLIHMNRFNQGNIKVLYWHKNLNDHYFYYFIPHVYPSPTEYENGVVVGILEAERKNPQIKVMQPQVRECANRLIMENDWYEVLLINHMGEITEGSRSNVFFVQNNQIVTPPTGDVLSGITRQKVLQSIKELGYLCIEEVVKLKDLPNFEAAFLTGTSPKVLPIKQIGDQQFSTQSPRIKAIYDAYEEKIQQDLQTVQTVVL